MSHETSALAYAAPFRPAPSPGIPALALSLRTVPAMVLSLLLTEKSKLSRDQPEIKLRVSYNKSLWIPPKWSGAFV